VKLSVTTAAPAAADGPETAIKVAAISATALITAATAAPEIRWNTVRT